MSELLRAIKVKGEFGAVGQKIFTNIKQVSAAEMQQLLQQTRGREYRGMDWLLIAKRSRKAPVVIMDAEVFFNIFARTINHD